MVKVQKTISLTIEGEKRIANFCRRKNITFSKFVEETALKSIEVENAK